VTFKVRTLRARGDTGLTLVEILVAIVILGVCVVALLGGTTTLPVATTVHREDAQADLILRNWAEAVKAKGLVTSKLCAPGNFSPYAFGNLLGAGLLPPTLSTTGFNLSPPDVTTWNPPPGTAWSGTVFQPCNSQGVVLANVHLAVSSADLSRPVSQSVEVVVAQS
jgi:prepilin-type N-terminal cleavage/methylation domain-containing protein